MASTEARIWPRDYGATTAAARRGGRYLVHIPDKLTGWTPHIDPGLTAGLSDVERLLRNTSSACQAGAFGRLFFWAESLGSSRIEGVSPSPRRVLHVQTLLFDGHNPRDGRVKEVLGNLAAMEAAVAAASRSAPLELDDILAAHRSLMDKTFTPELGGRVRDSQNWIGGGQYNPLGAIFVPPPPEKVPELLEDLVQYANTSEHNPVLQAAAVHAQFETIHPFVDGNGRTGRALIHAVLKRRGVIGEFTPPFSLYLSAARDDYLAGLSEFQSVAGSLSERLAPWLEVMVLAVARSCQAANAYATAVLRLQGLWRERSGNMRSHSLVARLLDVLPANPVLSLNSACSKTGGSRQRVSKALRHLDRCGILTRKQLGRRVVVFEAVDIFALYDILEQTITSRAAAEDAYDKLFTLGLPSQAASRDTGG